MSNLYNEPSFNYLLSFAVGFCSLRQLKYDWAATTELSRANCRRLLDEILPNYQLQILYQSLGKTVYGQIAVSVFGYGGKCRSERPF